MNYDPRSNDDSDTSHYEEENAEFNFQLDTSLLNLLSIALSLCSKQNKTYEHLLKSFKCQSDLINTIYNKNQRSCPDSPSDLRRRNLSECQVGLKSSKLAKISKATPLANLHSTYMKNKLNSEIKYLLENKILIISLLINQIQNNIDLMKERTEEIKNNHKNKLSHKIYKNSLLHSKILTKNSIDSIILSITKCQRFVSIYNSRKHGLNSSIFHKMCDVVTPTPSLMICKLNNNIIIGCFTCIGFLCGISRYISDNKCILFIYNNSTNNIITYNIVDYAYAINYKSYGGPCFGEDDITLLDSEYADNTSEGRITCNGSFKIRETEEFDNFEKDIWDDKCFLVQVKEIEFYFCE